MGFPQPIAPHRNMTNVAPLHGGINILLGGKNKRSWICLFDWGQKERAMMGGMLILVFCICYCCHKRVQKTEFPVDGETASEQWLQNSDDSDSNLHIFTLDVQCYEVEGLFNDPPTPHDSPPPAYHDIVTDTSEREDPNLPSYDEALRMQGMERHSSIYMDQLAYI